MRRTFPGRSAPGCRIRSRFNLRIDLKNTTIMIHAMNDHPDRVENLRIVLKWIRKHLDVKVLLAVNSYGSLDYSWAYSQVDAVLPFNEYLSHSTKYTNMMAEASGTPLVCHWCGDVILDRPESLLEAAKILESGWDFVWPYMNGYAIEQASFPILEKDLCVDRIPVKYREGFDQKLTVGYIIMARRYSWVSAGGFNEEMIEYGPIDKEAVFRWSAMGFRFQRTVSNVFHLRHWRPRDNGMPNPFADKNDAVFQKVKRMSPPQMAEYVKWKRNV